MRFWSNLCLRARISYTAQPLHQQVEALRSHHAQPAVLILLQVLPRVVVLILPVERLVLALAARGGACMFCCVRMHACTGSSGTA